jgi:hypothetical protein
VETEGDLSLAALEKIEVLEQKLKIARRKGMHCVSTGLVMHPPHWWAAIISTIHQHNSFISSVLKKTSHHF